MKTHKLKIQITVIRYFIENIECDFLLLLKNLVIYFIKIATLILVFFWLFDSKASYQINNRLKLNFYSPAS